MSAFELNAIKPGTPAAVVKKIHKRLREDAQSPAEHYQDTRIRVRVFVNGVRVDDKCYSTCGCGKIVVLMPREVANRWIMENCAEKVPDTVPLSQPGHESCSSCGGSDDPEQEVGPIIDAKDIEGLKRLILENGGDLEPMSAGSNVEGAGGVQGNKQAGD